MYFSTQQAAKQLGIGVTTLDRYIAAKKVPAPRATKIGNWNVRAWTVADIERVRALLPKIANGRKTRYQKLRAKQKAQADKSAPRKKLNSKRSKTTTKPPKAKG
jgi:excisionase family DNA binding protein